MRVMPIRRLDGERFVSGQVSSVEKIRTSVFFAEAERACTSRVAGIRLKQRESPLQFECAYPVVGTTDLLIYSARS